MAREDFTLQGIRSFDELITNSGEGSSLLSMLRIAGLLPANTKPFQGEEPKNFPVNVNSIRQDELGNQQLYWQYQLGRVTEMLGLIDALMADEDILLKRAKAKAKARVLREFIEDARQSVSEEESKKGVTVKLTKDQLDALIEDEQDIQSAEDRKARLHRMSLVLKAYKETYAGYCGVLSREVTRRGDVYKATR